MTRTSSRSCRSVNASWRGAGLSIAALALTGCMCGGRPMLDARYQENLMVKCRIEFPQPASDHADDLVSNHVTVAGEARECARRHNELVDALRGAE